MQVSQEAAQAREGSTLPSVSRGFAGGRCEEWLPLGPHGCWGLGLIDTGSGWEPGDRLPESGLEGTWDI